MRFLPLSECNYSLSYPLHEFKKKKKKVMANSSQFPEPLWTIPGLKCGISLRKLISTFKKRRKKAQAGKEWLNILPKSSQARKKPSPPNDG